MHGPRKLLAASSIGKDAGTLSLMWMRHARQHDNGHYLAIRCFLLHAAASMPSVRRATRGGSGVRWYEHVPQRAEMHTRQWIGTYGNRGNGDYQGELASALQAIKTYLAHFALTPEAAQGESRWAIRRCGGDYPTRYEAGVYLITRGRTYRMLERPELQRVLAHPASARVTALNTGEVVELFALWLASPR